MWFVMIKDEKGRYPGNPLWGDGWGWALFKTDAPDKQIATTTREIAWAATSRHRQQTGSMSKVIQFSPRSKQDDVTKLVFKNTCERRFCDEKVSVRNYRWSWPGRCEARSYLTLTRDPLPLRLNPPLQCLIPMAR